MQDAPQEHSALLLTCTNRLSAMKTYFGSSLRDRLRQVLLQTQTMAKKSSDSIVMTLDNNGLTGIIFICRKRRCVHKKICYSKLLTPKGNGLTALWDCTAQLIACGDALLQPECIVYGYASQFVKSIFYAPLNEPCLLKLSIPNS